jgi:hypothetical protein
LGAAPGCGGGNKGSPCRKVGRIGQRVARNASDDRLRVIRHSGLRELRRVTLTLTLPMKSGSALCALVHDRGDPLQRRVHPPRLGNLLLRMRMSVSRQNQKNSGRYSPIWSSEQILRIGETCKEICNVLEPRWLPLRRGPVRNCLEADTRDILPLQILSAGNWVGVYGGAHL